MAEDHLSDVGGMVSLAESLKNGKTVERQRKLAARLAQERKFATTMSQTGSWVNWGDMSEALGQPFNVNKIPLSKLDQMRRDPMISFGLMFVKVPIIRARWKIECVDPQRAAFVENALKQIYGRFVLAYLNCLDYGYSPIVKRFEYTNPDWTYVDPATDEQKLVWPYKTIQALTWKPFMPLNPRHARPKFNSKGEFSGIDFMPGSSDWSYGVFSSNSGRTADIPLDWSLWATNEKDSEFGSLYGYPRTGYAYRFWWSYWYKFGISDRAFEKWGDPPFVIFHPADEGVEDEDGNAIDFGDHALATAEQLRSGANVAMPSSVIRGYTEDRPTNIREWDFEQIETTANFSALNESFEYLDIAKLRAVLVPEQSLVEGKGGSSSRNVASEFGQLLKESQAVVMEEIDDHINRFMIPQLLEANFGDGPSCRKVTTGFDPQDVETMRAIVQGVVNTKGELPEADMQGILNQLNVPVLSYEAIQLRMRRIAEEQDRVSETQRTAERNKIVAQAALKGHKVDPSLLQHLDEEEFDELLDMADLPKREKGPIRRIYDRIVGNSDEIEEEIEE
jgi:hypothetical protein